MTKKENHERKTKETTRAQERKKRSPPHRRPGPNGRALSAYVAAHAAGETFAHVLRGAA